MADSHDLADADSDVPWEEEELDENESEYNYFSTDYGAPAHSANENMTDALRFNGEKFIIAAQYIAKQRAKLHHQLRNCKNCRNCLKLHEIASNYLEKIEKN